jgi:hypothetical protein
VDLLFQESSHFPMAHHVACAFSSGRGGALGGLHAGSCSRASLLSALSLTTVLLVLPHAEEVLSGSEMGDTDVDSDSCSSSDSESDSDSDSDSGGALRCILCSAAVPQEGCRPVGGTSTALAGASNWASSLQQTAGGAGPKKADACNSSPPFLETSLTAC